MDEEQQGAWWTKPPGTPTRPLKPSSARGGGPRGTAPTTPQGPADGTPGDEPTEQPIGRAGPPEDPVELYDRAPHVPAPEPQPPTRPHRPQPDPYSGPTPNPEPPTRPMEYLTVRLDPESPAAGIHPRPVSGDTMEVPAAAMPRLRQGPPGAERPAPVVRRGPAILLGVAVLAVIVTVAVIASRVATGVEPHSTRQTSTAAAPAPVTFSGTPPASLKQITDTTAKRLLTKAHHSAGGTIRQSFTWTDANGLNLLVTASNRTSSGTTLTVTQLARMGSKPRLLREMTDPDLPECDGADPKVGFTVGSMFVRDLDGDGVAEAVVGWSSKCGAGKSVAKLAVLSDGKKYIIRGEGDIGSAGSGSGVPDPVATSWPKKYLSPLTTLYRALYF